MSLKLNEKVSNTDKQAHTCTRWTKLTKYMNVTVLFSY